MTTHTATIGGIRFRVPVDFYLPDDGFFDLEIEVQWIPRDQEPNGIRLDAPSNLSVWIDPDRPIIQLPQLHDEEILWQWQLRQVAPIVAAWHDRLTMHASAVAIGDAAYAFVGESGVGKSTLAWELVKAGASPLADDLACVRLDSPHIPLPSQTVPIAKILFLSRSPAVFSVHAISKTEALEQHLRNGFGEHGDSRVWQFQFDACSHLADSVSHFNLTIPDDRARVADAAHSLLSTLPTIEAST